MIRDLIFDFDGTLADTSLGIVRCTQATLRELGVPESTPERICATIGLPRAARTRRRSSSPRPATPTAGCSTTSPSPASSSSPA